MHLAKGLTVVALAAISVAVGGIAVILTNLAADRQAVLVLLLVTVLVVGTLWISVGGRRLDTPYW